jgi:hypothetical protein
LNKITCIKCAFFLFVVKKKKDEYQTQKKSQKKNSIVSTTRNSHEGAKNVKHDKRSWINIILLNIRKGHEKTE